MTDAFPIADIDSRLDQLWRSAATAGGPALLRACALNLVVAGCGSEGANLGSILSEITRRHPCRAIVVQTDAEASGDPRAWASIMCHPGGRGEPEVCSEYLVLTSGPGTFHELVASVAGVLVGDVPGFLWWRGRPPETELEHERFDHLAGVSRRVLIDSFAYPAPWLAWAAGLARSRAALGDLNWARLTPWRAEIAQRFDPPGALAQLSTLESVKVVYAGRQPFPPAASLLLEGWLRSRVGRSAATRFPVQFAAGPVELVELHTASACFRIVRPASPADAEALSEELRVLGRDHVFEEALSAAAELP